ncbi:uncharacterized protein LOC130811315 [Amaranthus tricolor]|uniref:uncharacterized protein LOC130811315 n=1 Tax=Amaranthus tricolor TaxID=29722 RepID=UPI0025881C18|nr:uncharacterized protein LOC130811315 [Amaranthus tricolor]
MRTIPEDEKLFLVGDFKGHIGTDADNYNLVHGGFGLGARNESGENLLEFALAKELVIANSIFRKKDEHLITYKSSGHATQVDYFLVRKGDRASCLDCKVVLGTEMSTQHRLLVLVFRMRKKIVEKKVESRGKVMWGRLKGDMVITLSRKISLLGCPSQLEDANEMWKQSGPERKQIFKLARTRFRQQQNLEAVKYIKDEGGRVLLRQEDIKSRWLQYFSQLLNESRGLKEADNQISDVQRPLEYGSTSDITTVEVGEALKKMGRTKAVGPDNIPTEA